MPLRIENNKGFFEGAEMRHKQGMADQQTQQNEAEYLRVLQDQMMKQRMMVEQSMTGGNNQSGVRGAGRTGMTPSASNAKDKTKMLDYIDSMEKQLMDMGTTDKLWRVNEQGSMVKGNPYKTKATKQANLQREFDLMRRPDGTLRNEFSIYGTSFDPNLGRFFNTNPQGHGAWRLLPNGQYVWEPVHNSNLPLKVK